MSRESFAVSVQGKRIRLTAERWSHIGSRHPELRGLRDEVLRAIDNPRLVVKGKHDEIIAVRPMVNRPTISVIVVYRESGKDGFIITAYLTSDVRELERREKLWPSLS